MSDLETVSAKKAVTPPGTLRLRLQERAWPLLLPLSFLVLAVGAAVPVLSVKVPIMTDFVDHLGRMYVIAHLGDDPFLSRFYAVHWQLVPNLAMDAIVPGLARWIGIFAAGKAFVLLVMLLTVSGVHALHWALHRRLSVWPLAAFVFIYNWVFFYGFVNYLFCVGVALWGAAAWIALRERAAHPAWCGLVSLAFVLLLFFGHLQGIQLYGLPLLCYELWRLKVRGRPPWRRALPELLAFGLPFVLVLVLMRLSPTTGFAGETQWYLWRKLVGLWWVVKNYQPLVDLPVALLCLGFAGWALATRRLRVHPVGWYMLAASAVVFAATPWELMSASFVDTRLPVAFLFILIGMATWEAADRRATAGFCAVLVALCLARFAVVETTWRELAGVMGDYERSMAEIPRGSRVLVASVLDSPMRHTWKTALSHFPALVMTERSSMSSHAFTHPGKQVLVVKPPYRAHASYDGEPFDVGYLLATAQDPAASQEDDYWAGWPAAYDYVYVLFATPGTQVALPASALVYQGGTFQLYRVRHHTSQGG